MRQRFIFPGLVSDAAAILKLFVTKTPRARGLMTGQSKDLVGGTDSKLLALDSAYVTTHPRMRGVLRVEIDDVVPSWEGIADACDRAGLPLPNIAVGYVDPLGRAHNPHLIWILEHSVAFTTNARNPPKRLFTDVLRRITAALLPYGADPGGLTNALKTKNPLSPLWDRVILAATPYDLRSLRQRVDTVATADLRREGPAARPLVPDHPDPAIAIQSNRVFRELAVWARREVTCFRETGRLFEEFHCAVEDEACRICRGLSGGSDSRKAEQAIGRTVQCVAKWTWEKYQPRQPASAIRLTQTEVRARQAEAGKTTATARRLTSEAAILAAASALVAQSSAPPTQSDLVAATGRSERTIRRYWPLVAARMPGRATELANRSTPATRSPLDKKLSTTATPETVAAVARNRPPRNTPTDPLCTTSSNPSHKSRNPSNKTTSLIDPLRSAPSAGPAHISLLRTADAIKAMSPPRRKFAGTNSSRAHKAWTENPDVHLMCELPHGEYSLTRCYDRRGMALWYYEPPAIDDQVEPEFPDEVRDRLERAAFKVSLNRAAELRDSIARRRAKVTLVKKTLKPSGGIAKARLR